MGARSAVRGARGRAGDALRRRRDRSRLGSRARVGRDRAEVPRVPGLAALGLGTMPTPATTVDVDGYEIRVSNPDKVLFPEIGVTKMDLVGYYLTVADAALVGCRDRPTIMHRFPNG